MYFCVVTREIVDSCISTSSATSFKTIGFIASSPYSKKVLLLLHDAVSNLKQGFVTAF